MGVSSRGGLIGFIARLGRPPVADSDADLLDQFVRTADEAAFTAIVHRHGPMVLSVCRRRLGHSAEADVEDAFQAVFLALAKSARSIGRRESLPGWLYRVAYLVSLKAAGRRARHPAVALPASEVPMPDPPLSAVEADELKSAIDAELAGLPDKFRAVVVLCLIEGRTNAEAATVLGVPVGTVDSRLNTARSRLKSRLTRRGVAVGTGMGLGQMLGGPLVASEGLRFTELVTHTVRAVLAEASGSGAGAVTPAVEELARGVTMLTTTKLRLLAAVAVALGILGGAGAGVYFASAADDTLQATKPADPPAAAAKPEGGKLAAETTAAQGDGKGTAAALDRPLGVKADGLPMGELLDAIEEMTGLVVRVDVAAFRRIGAFDTEVNPDDATLFLRTLYDAKPVLPRKMGKLPIRDVLADALAQARGAHPSTFQVRGSQLVIVPAFVPPVRPGTNPLDPNPEEGDSPLLSAKILNEQIYGPVVSVTADRKPLAEILADLRKQTGANIILDPRCEAVETKKATVTVALSDVRLYDALRVIADMSDLKMVYAGNIYYVTTQANAKTFQPPTPKPQMQPFGGQIPQQIPQPPLQLQPLPQQIPQPPPPQ